jgi:hypothetical protein
MAVATLTQLILETRQKADMEYSNQFITDAEITGYLNQSIRDLFDLVVDHGDHTWVPSSDVTAVASGTGTYSLTTAYKLLGMWFTQGNQWTRVKPISSREALEQSSPDAQFTPERSRYLVTGRAFSNTLGLIVETYPRAPAGTPATFRVIVQPTTLVSGADSMYFPNGWGEYVVTDAAIKCLEKEESSTSALSARREMLRARIIGATAALDRVEPKAVTDVSSATLWDDDV